MNISGCNRNEWEFEYTARKLAEGAQAQKDHRLARAEWWTAKKNEVMAQIREKGIEVRESVAEQNGFAYATTMVGTTGPAVTVRSDLQAHLAECHSKIQLHTKAAAEYDGWIQVLTANPENRLKLTQADWLYFFGKV